MKRLIMMLVVVLIAVGCQNATEQGTVMVETYWGKIVKIHEPGDYFMCASPGCGSFEVDFRDHVDGFDCAGVTSDNIPFTMKVDVVHRPIRDKLAEYITLFGADEKARTDKRWNVMNQHVKTACRNATSGKYGAYALRAEQGKIMADMGAELGPKLASEMAMQLGSVGMEKQPEFDARIDQAANAVVAAQKQKEAEDALKAAADVRALRQQVEAQIYANPNAMKIEELKLLLEIERVRADGIKGHQGTLILGAANTQVQIPGGK